MWWNGGVWCGCSVALRCIHHLFTSRPISADLACAAFHYHFVPWMLRSLIIDNKVCSIFMVILYLNYCPARAFLIGSVPYSWTCCASSVDNAFLRWSCSPSHRMVCLECRHNERAEGSVDPPLLDAINCGWWRWCCGINKSPQPNSEWGCGSLRLILLKCCKYTIFLYFLYLWVGDYHLMGRLWYMHMPWLVLK